MVELVAKGGWETLGEVFRESSQAAPWLRYVVGAPKKGAAKAKGKKTKNASEKKKKRLQPRRNLQPLSQIQRWIRKRA